MQPKVVSNSSKGFIPGPKTDFRTAGLEASPEMTQSNAIVLLVRTAPDSLG